MFQAEYVSITDDDMYHGMIMICMCMMQTTHMAQDLHAHILKASRKPRYDLADELVSSAVPEAEMALSGS